jgi:hypothetical protein
MKSPRSFLLFILALGLAGATLRAQSLSSFTAGDLVVEEIGNGTTALTSAATPIFLDEYTPTGTLVGNVALPTTNGSGLDGVTDSGSAGTDGFITLSPNGEYIAFGGYNDAVGNASVTSSSSSTVERVDGTVDVNGNITTTLLGTTEFSATNIRGAFATDPTDVWANGHGNNTTDGIWYTNGTTSTLVANQNLRTIGYADGQLLAANATNILMVGSGLPTSGNVNPTTTSLITTSGTALEQFVFVTEPGSSVTGPNTLYVANSGSNSTAILKYTLTSGTTLSGTWVATGSANISAASSTSTVGAFGLTGVVNGNGSVSIYGTTSGSASTTGVLFGLTDSSGYDGTLSGGVVDIANASANETFRGVTFAPESAVVPEPSVYAMLFGAGALGLAVARRRRGNSPAAGEVVASVNSREA